MELNAIFTILGYLLFILTGFRAACYKSKHAITTQTATLIASAEQEFAQNNKAGEDKFAWVADQLYALTPAVIRPFIPRALVETLIQTTFDALEDYTKLQLEKLAAKAGEKNA